MNFRILIACLLNFSAILNSFAQDDLGVSHKRKWSLGFNLGNTSFLPINVSESSNRLINTIVNPILSGPFRYFAINGEVEVSKKWRAGIDVGFCPTVSSIALRDTANDFSWDYVFFQNNSYFVEPSVNYEFFIDSNFRVLTGLGVSLYFQLPKFSTRDEPEFRNADFAFDTNKNLNNYFTVNPKIEFRFIPTKKLQFGIVVKYLQGLQETVNLIGVVSDEKESLNYSTSYDASGILLAFRLAYQIQ